MGKAVCWVGAWIVICATTSCIPRHLEANDPRVEASVQVLHGDWDAAKESFKGILLKDSTDSNANQMLGRIAYMQGAYLEAIEYLNKVPASNGSPWAPLTLAWCYDAVGDRGRAIEAYARTLRLETQLSIERAARRGLKAPHSPVKRVKGDKGINDIEIGPEGWKAIAKPNPGDASMAFDRNLKTKWYSIHSQLPGMTYQLDLGSARVVNRVVFNDDAGGGTVFVNDFPREYDVEVSLDGQQWQLVASEIGDLDSYAGAVFEPTEVRYIKITQRGSTLVEGWSIYEVFVYTPGTPQE